MTRPLDERVMQIWRRTYHVNFQKADHHLIVERLLQNSALLSWIRNLPKQW